MSPPSPSARIHQGLLVFAGAAGWLTSLAVYGVSPGWGLAVSAAVFAVPLALAVGVSLSAKMRAHTRGLLIACAYLISGVDTLKLMAWPPVGDVVWVVFVTLLSAVGVSMLARRWTEVAAHGVFVQAVLALGAAVTPADPRQIGATSAAMLLVSAGASLLAHNRRRTEEALVAARAEAERQRDRAEHAARAKSDFLASMSHEIRTPMNGVVGMADLLSDTALSAEQTEFVGTIRTSGLALLTILNDILDLSKIEAGGLVLEEIAYDPGRVAREAAAIVRPQAEAAGLSVTVEVDAGVPEAVTGDPTRVRQVLLNLLSNAVKFTHHGGVTVRVDAPAPDRLSIEVRDTGVGIAPDRLAAVFESFTQADASTTREYGGTGLGLAISTRLAEHMGGGLEAESEVGHGSVFRLTVAAPAARVEAAAPVATDSASGARPARLRVLVAEDNAVNQRVVTKLLERLGYDDVEVTEDGEAALAALHGAADRGHAVDVVLMDVQMPRLDGLAATRRLRTELAPDDQPAVWMLTANAMDEDREAALLAGADGFLTKPLVRSALAEALEAVQARPTSPMVAVEA